MTSVRRRRPPAVPAPALGSRLLGRTTDATTVVRVRVQALLTASLVVANSVGAAVVGVLLVAVIPGPSTFTSEQLLVNVVAVPVYLGGALLVGVVGGTVLALRALRWAVEGREPTPADQVATLAVPWRLTLLQLALWAGGAVLFTTLYGLSDPVQVFRVGFTTGLGALVVCANAYLLTEFALRPVAARALAAGVPARRRFAGAVGRTLLAWALGSGVPVAGLMVVAVFALVRQDVSAARMAVTALVLGGVTLCFGLLLTLLSANATLAPIRSVRQALARVQSGELDTRVVVFDGTELGELQTGFNRMAEGLGEREHLRDLFGRHVGRDVARAALARSPELGGEEREVAVFFVDLVGSTELAATHPPAEVVGLLNRFFAVVVDEVERRHGFINKFQGDGALAVFGAPNDCDDPAGEALAAARAIAERLRVEVPECSAGTGVSAGVAVAGNIGHESRFEYTVIGDPVNEAARLSEVAKTLPGGVVASAAAVRRTESAEEVARWQPAGEAQLRGRPEATALAVPVGADRSVVRSAG